MSKKIIVGDWVWAGMGYRPNGDGFGKFKNFVTGQRVRYGAMEAGWVSGRGESFKEACARAMERRIAEGKA